MRAHLTAAATAALLLGLVGCSAAPDETPTEEPAANAETTEVEPLTAEPVEEEATSGTPEEAYLAAVREVAERDDSQIRSATDEQLLAAGEEACVQISNGTAPDLVRVIEGEQPDALGWYADSQGIGVRASEYLCPS